MSENNENKQVALPELIERLDLALSGKYDDRLTTYLGKSH